MTAARHLARFLDTIAAHRRTLNQSINNPLDTTRRIAVQSTINQAIFQRLAARRGLQTKVLFQAPAATHVDDKALRDFNKSLDDFDFHLFPHDLLGRIYEQSLAQPDAPTTRKSRGVYYTPTTIVDDVVSHTLAPRLNDRSHDRPLRILDPACGGGAFLLGAYQHLLDWYESDARLTIPQRIRILTDHIHGVDIDPQAVEITRLSLLLKVFEGESADHHEALPDLTRTIKRGNALISANFHEDTEPRHPTNPFDWNCQFPHAFADGGFDAIIGNPPWGQKRVNTDAAERDDIVNRFPSSAGIFDLFRPFTELPLHVGRPGAMFGLVLPDIILLKNYQPTRDMLLSRTSLDRIDWWGMAFDDATIDACTIIGATRPPAPDHIVRCTVRPTDRAPLTNHIAQEDFLENPRHTLNVYMTPQRRAVLRHVQQFPTFDDLVEIHEGVHSGNIRAELFVDAPVNDDTLPMYFGRAELAPYRLRWDGRYINLDAMKLTESSGRYANTGRREWFDRPSKLLIRRTGDRLSAALDTNAYYCSNNFFVAFSKDPDSLTDHALLALLNSRVYTWLFQVLEPRVGRAFAEVKIKNLRSLPVPDSPDALRTLDRLAKERMALQTNVRSKSKTSPRDGVNRCNMQIDALVAAALELTQTEDQSDWTTTRRPGSTRLTPTPPSLRRSVAQALSPSTPPPATSAADPSAR